MLGVAVFGLLVSAFTGALIYSQQAAADSGQRIRATFLADEALEAVRNIGQDGWNEFTVSATAVENDSTEWSLTGEGTDETIGNYTRQVTFSDVCRDSSDELADCPANYIDINSKFVTATVSWTGRYGTERTVVAETLLTNWSAEEWLQTDWTGGDAQASWIDDTMYFSDDGNLETGSAGQVSLAAVTNANDCGTKNWHFQDSGLYSYDAADIEISDSQAQLVDSSESLNFEVGTVIADNNFTTVNLANSYTSPVVVLSHVQASNTLPISARIDNVTSNSFEVRLQHANTSESALSSETINYMVMEEGSGTLGSTQIEAHLYDTSTMGSGLSSWTADAQTYDNTYTTAPAVFHSVMTSNDTDWTSSWISLGSTRASPPSASGFQLALNGAQVYTSHASETLGWIAIDQTTGDSVESINFESDQTTDSITGYGTSLVFPFTTTFSTTPIVIASQQEMDGGDGSWMAINSVTSTQVGLNVDEDQVFDAERSHTTETGAWVAFGSSLSTTVETSAGYSSASPVINPTTSYEPEEIGEWSSFSETATKDGVAEIYYQLSDDGGATWQYWNGSSWAAVSSSTDYNTAAEIDSQITSFDTSAGQLTWQAIFVSDGTDQVQLDTVSLTCSNSQSSTFDTASDYSYDSSLIQVTGSAAQLVTSGNKISDIENSITDSFEFDTNQGTFPVAVNVSGDIYAIAYSGVGNDGFISTVEINSSGEITSPAIDTLEFDTVNGLYPSLVQVDSDTYAIAYTGIGSDGWLATVEIDASGNIASAVTDKLEFDTSNGLSAWLIAIDSDTLAIAYRGVDNDGFLSTVEVDSSGNLPSTVTDTLEFDVSNGIEPVVIAIDSDTLAIAYRGVDNDGFLSTVEVDSSGNLPSTVTDTLEFDTVIAVNPEPVLVDSDTLAIAYAGPGNDGFIATVDVDSSGNIASAATDLFEYDTTQGLAPSFRQVDDDVFAVAYRGVDDDGYLSLIEIDDGGGIGAAVGDTLEYDTANGLDPFLLEIDTQVYAIAYRGPDLDGWIASVQFNTSSTYPVTESSIYPVSSVSVPAVNSWLSFSENSTVGSGSAIFYQLSDDDGVTWRYWDGSTWAPITADTDYNTAEEVDSNISSFSVTAEQFLFKAFFVSDGDYQAELNQVTVGYTVSTENYNDWTIDDASAYTYDSAAISQSDNHAELLAAATNLNFEVGQTSTDDNWATVTTTETYTNPVIVATHTQTNNTEPVSVRLRNVSSNSFDIRLQHAHSPEAALATDTINYIVMEEGSGTIGSTPVEAHRVTTSTTASSSSWVGDQQTYDNTYTTAPIVLHQIMSYNDSDWASTFVSSPSARTGSPTTSGFQLAINRAQAGTEHDEESLGWIAIGQSSGDTVDSTDFETSITTDSITGNGTAAIFNFTGTYASSPIVIGSQQKMDGADGSWLVMNSSSATQVSLFVDEETIADSERTHTTETGAYAVFSQVFSTAYGTGDRYPTDEPTLTPSSGFTPASLSYWSGFSANEVTGDNSAIYFQLSDNGGSDWKYWNGDEWTITASLTDYNTAEDVNDNLDELDPSAGQLTFRAFMVSNGIDQVELENVRLYYGESGATYQTSGQLISSGFDFGSNGAAVHSLSWEEVLPICTPDCSVEIEVSAAPDDGSGSPDWPAGTDWYGTTGSGDTFTTATGETISTDLNDYRWLRYRVTLTGDGAETPVLEEVRFRYHLR